MIKKRVTYPSHTTAHLFLDAVTDAADVAGVADAGDNLCFWPTGGLISDSAIRALVPCALCLWK